MHLHCQSCGALIQSEDMDLATMLAKCRACHAVMSFADKLGVQPQGAAVTSKERPRVPQPSNVHLVDTGDAMRITWRWFHPVFIFLFFFCIAWDGFLIFWYSMAFAGGAPWIMKGFPIVHLAVGVGLTYFTLAGFVNSTSIDVGADLLKIRHGPLPWAGNHTLALADLDQLYCQERFHTNRRGRPSLSFQVNAVLKNGRKVTLVSLLQDRDHALFLEQILEKALNIADRPVGGELPR